jgi:hypothetical protein
MRTAYRVLAYVIALEVLVQAASVSFAFFGLGKWIEDGGVANKAAMDSESIEFTGSIGFPIHAINGQMVIPLLALILLIVSFFVKARGAVLWAGIVLLLVVVQVLLGIFGHDVPWLGPLHGINALVLFGLAAASAQRLKATAPVTTAPAAADTAEAGVD